MDHLFSNRLLIESFLCAKHDAAIGRTAVKKKKKKNPHSNESTSLIGEMDPNGPGLFKIADSDVKKRKWVYDSVWGPVGWS